MRILHITNWYPNLDNPREAVWIKNIINALPADVQNDIVHFEIKIGTPFRRHRVKHENLNQVILYTPFKVWFVIELIYFFWLYYQFKIRRIQKRYDLINFHIAYPMLTYWHRIKKSVDKPVVISEHWSAYHFNFGVKKKLPRIQGIFLQNIPVIAVSHALARDIVSFANAAFPVFVVPNVVDRKVFYPDQNITKENFFFMISQWKAPKNPFVAMEAFAEFNVEKRYVLKIAGYGPMWEDMQRWVNENHASEWVHLVGGLESYQVADYMRRCRAFLHPSEYETFSVVCAEALACGTWVIAPRVGGIPEVVNGFGMLLETGTKVEWTKALQTCDRSSDFKREPPVSYSQERVGREYLTALQSVIDNHRC